MSNTGVDELSLQHIDTSIRIIEKAFWEWKPSAVFMLYSGGYDSLVSTHIAMQTLRALGKEHLATVASIDTCLSADAWQHYVATTAASFNWHHEIWMNPRPEFYYEFVRTSGTPYTRQIHWQMMYRNLKERALDIGRASRKNHPRDRCLLISGMRRAESPERANTPETLKDGAGLWVSPIVYWSDMQVYEYRVSRSFPVNPFYETIGGSGDCACNWTCKTSLDLLWQYSPLLASQIQPVSDEAKAKFGWGYGERPSKTLIAERRGQMVLPGIEPVMNLCAGCDRPRPDASQALEWRQLQEGL